MINNVVLIVIFILTFLPCHTYRPHSFQAFKPPRSSFSSWTLEHELDIFPERKGLHDLISGVVSFAVDLVVVQESPEEYEDSNGGEEAHHHVVLQVPGPAVDVAV